MELEIRGVAGVECMEKFSEGSYFSSKDYVYGGLFWFSNEEYAKSWSILIYKLLKGESPLKSLRDELEKFLREPNYQLKGDAKYVRSLVVQRSGLWRALKSSELLQFDRFGRNSMFNVVVGKVAGFGERSGLAFLKIAGRDGGKVDRETIWECRKALLRAWESLTSNQSVKEELSKARSFIQAFDRYMAQSNKTNPLFLKLVGFFVPFDFKGFSGSVLVSKARLFEKRKKAKEILDEIKKEDKDKILWDSLLHALRKEIYKTKNEEQAQKEFLEFLRKWEDPAFLTQLRADWKEVLKKLIGGAREEFLGAFVQRDEVIGRLSYGTFYAPSKKLKVHIFYEKGLESKLSRFEKGFDRNYNAAKKGKYIGDAEVELTGASPIEDIIYNFERLKKLDFDKKLGTADSLDLLFGLLTFACWLKKQRAIAERENSLVAALFLLDTDEGYDFWNYFRFIYDFFGIPVQTLNRGTIEELSNSVRTDIFKNLFISLLKDQKSLRFKVEGFDLPQDLSIHVILEKPSVGFCYERGLDLNQTPKRHFMYERYLVKVEDHTVSVYLQDKTIVLAGGSSAEKSMLRKWIEESLKKQNAKLCFITAGKWEDSCLEELIAQCKEAEEITKRSLFAQYSELPTAYISKRAERDCFVIYTTEFDTLKERLKIKEEERRASIAIKPAFKDDRFILGDERFYHSALQVFTTKGVGWDKLEVYSEKKNLFLLSVLSLSLYESESFTNPYSKLDLWQRRKTVYLYIERNGKEYRIPLNSTLYEMLYFLGKVPDHA